MEREQAEKSSFLRYLLLTILGGFIGLPFSFIILSDVATRMNLTSLMPPLGITETFEIIIIFFVVGIVYSTAASLVLGRRRIVAPLYVQFCTSLLLILVVLLSFFLLKRTEGVLMLYSGSVYLLLALSVNLTVGLAQTPLVVYLAGKSGGREFIKVKSMTIASSLHNVSSLFSRLEVKKALNIVGSKQFEGYTVYDCKMTGGSTLHIVVGEDPRNKDWSQLAIIRYKVGYYGMVKGERDESLEFILRPVDVALESEGIAKVEEQGKEAEMAGVEYILSTMKGRLKSWSEIKGYEKATLLTILFIFLIIIFIKYIGIIPELLFDVLVFFSSIAFLLYSVQFLLLQKSD